MDPLTHLLAGYIIGSLAFTGPLVAWTTFMAFFPDFDTVSWVWRSRPRWLRHRGVTHSLVVGVAASALGAVVMALAWDAPLGLAFVAGMLGFFSHVALDVANWGCLLLWPWRREGVEFTVQKSLLGPAVGSAVGWGVLAAGARWGLAREAIVLVALAWVAYLVAKLAMKIALVRRHGGDVYPTGNMLRWNVFLRRRSDTQVETRFVEATFRPLPRERLVVESRHGLARPALPLRTPDDAAAFTFHVPEVQSLAAEDLALAVDVHEEDADAWTVRWYALDFRRGSRCPGAVVKVDAMGEYTAERGVLTFAPPAPAT